MTEANNQTEAPADLTARDVLQQKLIDAMTPGAIVEFDPHEAEQAGAFVEDALTEAQALESTVDLLDARED